ncbi:UNVERIFIED_CONTAM: hypothetical protein NCL1_58992 [Trichonephila clavipes]
MLLRGLTWLVFFQLLGTGLNVLVLPFLPGPIIGMLLMVVYLCVRGGVSESISLAASGLLTYLPLILVPPAVGIMAYGSEILADATAILVTLALSLALSRCQPPPVLGRCDPRGLPAGRSALSAYQAGRVSPGAGLHRRAGAGNSGGRAGLRPLPRSGATVAGTAGAGHRCAGGAAVHELSPYPQLLLAGADLFAGRRYPGDRACGAAGLAAGRRANDHDDPGTQVGDLADCHVGGRADRRCGGAGGGVRDVYRCAWGHLRPDAAAPVRRGPSGRLGYGDGPDRACGGYLACAGRGGGGWRLFCPGHEPDGHDHRAAVAARGIALDGFSGLNLLRWGVFPASVRRT